MGTLFDYLTGGLLILNDPLALAQTEEKIENDIDRFLLKAGGEERFFLSRESSTLTAAEVADHSRAMRQIYITGLTLGSEATNRSSVQFALERDIAIDETARQASEEEGLLGPLTEKIRGWIGEGNRVTFVCGGEDCLQRMGHLFSRYDLPVRKAAGAFLDGIDAEDAAAGPFPPGRPDQRRISPPRHEARSDLRGGDLRQEGPPAEGPAGARGVFPQVLR